MTLTANAQTKIYGDADPSLTFTATGFKWTDNASSLTGSLSRAVGENVGSYAIASSFANSNYTINYIPANLDINPVPIPPVVPVPVEPVPASVDATPRTTAVASVTSNVVSTILNSSIQVTSSTTNTSTINISAANSVATIGAATITMLSNGKLMVESSTDSQVASNASPVALAPASTSTDAKTESAAIGSTKQESSKEESSTSTSTNSSIKAAKPSNPTTVAKTTSTETTVKSNTASAVKTEQAATTTATTPQSVAASVVTTPASTPAQNSPTQSQVASVPAKVSASSASSNGTKESDAKTTSTSSTGISKQSVQEAKAALNESIISAKTDVGGGSSGVDTLKSSLTEAAVAKGVPRQQAEQASSYFAKVLVQNLAKGMSMTAATNSAQGAFNSVVDVKPATPQTRIASSLTGTGGASELSALSGANTAQGSRAFEASLSANLAKGLSLEQATLNAQNSVKEIEAAAKLGNSSANNLMNGTGTVLEDKSASFQDVLSNAMVKGISPTEALARATAASLESAAAAKADVSRPSTGLSSNNTTFVKTLPTTDGFSKSVEAQLNRGISLEQAIKNAADTNALQQKAIQADAKNPLVTLSSGTQAIPKGDKNFDKVLATALSQGNTPEMAISKAISAVKNMPENEQTTSASLATGKNVDTVLSTQGHSQTFNRVLGAALARGVDIDKAIATAKRAETASDIPAGTLPIKVTAVVNGKTTVIEMTETINPQK